MLLVRIYINIYPMRENIWILLFRRRRKWIVILRMTVLVYEWGSGLIWLAVVGVLESRRCVMGGILQILWRFVRMGRSVVLMVLGWLTCVVLGFCVLAGVDKWIFLKRLATFEFPSTLSNCNFIPWTNIFPELICF